MSTSVSATGSISSAGLGSGLDVNSIVSSLMAVESRPLTLLQNAASSLNTQVSAFGQLQSLTSGMRDAANALTSLTLWGQTTTSSSDASSVAVSTIGTAAVGSYSVSVQNLAQSQTVSSSAFASSSTLLGEGTLTIELGGYVADGSSTAFKPNDGSSPMSIAIGPGETSLASIRDKINAAGAGVTASIVTDASGARLALRSSNTGAQKAFRISTGDDALSSLTYDGSTGAASAMTLNQSALDANATINGIAVTSASNKLDGVADGLTMTLLKATSGNVDVGVSADSAAVTSAVTKFVSAFNSLASYIRTNTKYDATSKTGGVLQGDRTVTQLQGQLRGIINQGMTGGRYAVLSEVGVTMQSDGTLAVDSTKLTNAVANRTDLKHLFSDNGSTTATQGFMTRFRNLGDSLLSQDGAIPTRESSLQSMLKSNGNSQTAMQNRLDQIQARLQKQYQALDTSMAQLNSTSSYLTQQLAAMNAKTA
jgi:flagellar hook-associated protein 2